MGSWQSFCSTFTWFTTSASIKWWFPTFSGLRKTTGFYLYKMSFRFNMFLSSSYLKWKIHHYKMSFGFNMFLKSSYLKGTPRRYKMIIGFNMFWTCCLPKSKFQSYKMSFHSERPFNYRNAEKLKMSFPSFWYKMQGTAPFWNLNYSQDTALIRRTRPPIL